MRLPMLLALACMPILLGACGNMLHLKEELRISKEELRRISVVLSSPRCKDCPIVLAALEDPEGNGVGMVQVYEREGAASIIVPAKSRFLFAFHDLNHDFECQDDEARGWTELPSKTETGFNTTITLSKPAANTCPRKMGNLFTADLKQIQAGRVVRLEDERFSAKNAELGMWQPLTFMREHHAGIYFLEDYSKHKTPVLFVHGINGTPQNFASLIQSLDKEKYQPWVLYYPSGVSLDVLSNGLYVQMNALHHRYGFNKLHLVAHSMGGLVASGYVQKCAANNACEYLRTYVSMASPFGGVGAAASGVKYSPVVMPVWKSLSPDSLFLSQLFSQSPPPDSRHYLMFAYRNGGGLGGESGDGTIPLSSQLRPAAQNQAARIYGFNDSHMGILTNPDVHAQIRALLNGEN